MRISKPARLQSKQSYCGCDKSVVVLHSLWWPNVLNERWKKTFQTLLSFKILQTALLGNITLHEVAACVCTSVFLFTVPVHKLFSQTMSPGGELLASAGDEWRAHRASIPALLPARLGTSSSCHHCTRHRLARRLRMDHTQCVRTGARRCVSGQRRTHAHKYTYTHTHTPPPPPLFHCFLLLSPPAYTHSYGHLSTCCSLHAVHFHTHTYTAVTGTYSAVYIQIHIGTYTPTVIWHTGWTKTCKKLLHTWYCTCRNINNMVTQHSNTHTKHINDCEDKNIFPWEKQFVLLTLTYFNVVKKVS